MPEVGGQTGLLAVLWTRYVLYHEPWETTWAILTIFTVLDLSFGVDSKGTYCPRHGPGPSPRYGPNNKAGIVSCRTERHQSFALL